MRNNYTVRGQTAGKSALKALNLHSLFFFTCRLAPTFSICFIVIFARLSLFNDDGHVATFTATGFLKGMFRPL